MSDRSTPNLPSRDFSKTSAFFANLGFSETWRDEGWMILERGEIMLEFFPHGKLDPGTSWFSCCLRFDDVDAFYNLCKFAGIPEASEGFPRLHAPRLEPWGGRVGALVDLDGTLLRLIEG